MSLKTGKKSLRKHSKLLILIFENADKMQIRAVRNNVM